VASIWAVIAGAVVAGVFVARAAIGTRAASAYKRGEALTADARHDAAVPLLDRGAYGANRSEALWLAGQARLGYWDTLNAPDRIGSRGQEALRAAAARFLQGLAGSPGSGWFTAGLAGIYARRESVFRSGRAVDLTTLDRGPWALMGDDGRIAIGLTRAAIDRQPNSFEFRDQLVLLLEANGLHEDALRAMDDAARVLPDFRAHEDFVFESLPRDLVLRFWGTARSLGPGEAPFQLRERNLLSLGQLGRRLGRFEEAEQDLRAALDAPGTELFHAEDAFHLALVLVDLGRLDEAEIMLARAVCEPVFEPGVAETRARIAEKRERWTDALEQLREARRLRPRELGVLLELARVAQKAASWDQAEESLRWAILVHPENPTPHRAMVEMFLATGEKAKARIALDEYVRTFGGTEDAARLEQALAAPLDPARR
jgi:tetratricopeptide (TPR) repeat protein